MILNKFKYKLFGRFKGRKRNSEISSLNLQKYQINFENDIIKQKYNILDIGSGSGENAIKLSSTRTNSKIITCELFEDGNINLYNEIIKKNINNISLFQGNVLEFFDLIQKEKFFNEIWILFPDPWPKIRHHKRRLLNENFLKKIHSYLKKDGKLMIASDSATYLRSIFMNIYKVRDYFVWKNQHVNGWNYQYLDLPKTKFYKKAMKSNRNIMFIELIKI